MSQSVDFRINDLINEYLDYKGYSNTVDTFSKERQNRQEPINKITHENFYKKDDEKYKIIKEQFLKHLDNGNREEFFQLWSQHIPANVINNDPSLKSLEFLLYTHFATYYLRPNIPNKNEKLAEENMYIFKTYMESIKGQTIAQTSEILSLFALPYVAEPNKQASFQDLFSDEWPIKLRTKVSNFFDWIFSNRPLPKLVELLQNGERASLVLTQINVENEELKYRNRETNRQIKYISTDYCNLISITMELVETLQEAVIGRTITNEYIDNVCARLGLTKLHNSMSHVLDSSRLGIEDPFVEKLDYGKIKRDIVHLSTTSREKALLLQALRWKLTKAKTEFKREKILECYIACDLLGCRSDVEQRTKVIKQLSSSIGGDAYYVKEEWARLINTIASLRQGRNYLAPNESLIICMQKAAISESSDTLIKQHLLAALQKLSLKRSVQTIMINQNIIKWLISSLSKTDRLSDYTLGKLSPSNLTKYGVALLMNLCLRTSGRKKCVEVAEQAITVLSSLLTHPNQETRPYVNSSLYSILTLKSIRDKALQLDLDHHLRSLIQTENTNLEIRGQLEFLLNLLCKGSDHDGRQSSDNEQENDDEDQDIMEADLDLGDKLHPLEKELSGEKLIIEQYASKQSTDFQIPYSSLLYSSTTADLKSKSTTDPILNRPTTPGQLRHSNAARTVDTLANNLFIADRQDGQNDKSESQLHTSSATKTFSTNVKSPIPNDQQKQTNSVFHTLDSDNEADTSTLREKTATPMKYSIHERPRSNSSDSVRSSVSSVIELNTGKSEKKF